MTANDDVVRAQNGEAGAFDALYQKHYPLVYWRCYKAFHNKEDAEDVSQDVFMKVFSQLSHFRHESNFQTWLFRITSNQIRDRDRKTRRTPVSEPLEDFHIQTFTVPPDQFAHTQVQEAFGKISESEQLLVKQMSNGASPEDIAENAGCKKRSVTTKFGKIRCKVYNHIYN